MLNSLLVLIDTVVEINGKWLYLFGALSGLEDPKVPYFIHPFTHTPTC